MQQLEERCFIQKDLVDINYPGKDYHYMYVVEIEKILEQDK